jgi:phenylalanyl-tRNA synthetase alpha chain
MIERIDELRAQAETEIAAASAPEALEELRVRYLGRKAELPQMLRGVAQLPPDQRGAVGKAANQARQALESLIEQVQGLDMDKVREQWAAQQTEAETAGAQA